MPWLFLIGLSAWALVVMNDESARQVSSDRRAAALRESRPLAARRAGINESNSPQGPPPAKRPAAFDRRRTERFQMVDLQIESRGIKDPNVLQAMRSVPRHAFVASRFQAEAYEDRPLPIEHQQTISQPYIVAFMTEALALDPNDRVLEIGTGSGYQAAVCAEIAKEVYTIEIIESLARSAAERLETLEYRNVHVKAGDGYFGWPEHGPFDAIIGTAAAGRIPQPLLDQLKPKGRMILPQEDRRGYQYLVLVTKDADGSIHKREVLPVRFVPMTGEVERP